MGEGRPLLVEGRGHIAAEARRRGRRWPWVVALVAASVTATMVHDPGTYVADNRFELFWDPGQRMARSFTAWDGTRGLGRVREEYWPGVIAVVWLLRALGASPAVAQHLFHAVLLGTAATGAANLLWSVVPRRPAWVGALAGSAYAFGAYAAVFLVPSLLFLHFALLPWLLTALVYGVTSGHPWRWAAVVGLLVAAVGNADLPGLAYAAIAVAIAAAYLAFADGRTSWRAVGGWLIGTAALAGVTAAAAISKVVIGAGAYQQRLLSTEQPEIAAATSSWTESLRGVGFWVSYFRTGGALSRPQGEVLFSNAALVLVTVLPVVGALAALGLVRTRARLLYGTLLAAGAVLMVGAHPLADPSTWGRLWLWTNESLPGFSALRSTYKAGGVAVIGMASLFALGTSHLAWRAREPSLDSTASRLGRWAPAVATIVVVAVAHPFWAGRLYDPALELRGGVPDYWLDAMDWLDQQPGDTAVLILPGSTRSLYRWGSPGDDVHDTFLSRRHAIDVPIALTTPPAADVLEAIDDAVVDGSYESGTLAPVLRRIGVEYVMLRNDLDWQRMDLPRPADFSSLRRDPDLVRVATFGEAGQNTVGTVDGRTPVERRLAPVEVYRLRGPAVSVARAAPADRWTVVEGAGAGWFQLAEAGLLVDGSPLAYAASLDDDDDLTAQLRGAVALVVTDSNRRSVRAASFFDAARSRTVGADEDLERPILDLFDRRGSASVATHSDALTIVDPDVRSVTGHRPEHRPSQLVDGDLGTGWVVPPIPDPVGRTVHVELAHPTVVDGFRATAFDHRAPDRAATGGAFTGVPRPARVVVRLSNGDEHVINTITGRGGVDFPPVAINSFEVRIESVTAEGSVGLAELQLSGSDVDLREFIRAPDSTFRRADGVPALKRALEAVPVVYLFDRATTRDGEAVESQLRREFTTAGRRTFELRGRSSTAHITTDDGCTDVGIEIDGRRVPVRATARHGAFEACRGVRLDAGQHRLDGGEGVVVDEMELQAGTARDVNETDAGLTVISTSDGHREYELTADGPVAVISGDAFDERWQATSGDQSLGSPVMLDAQNAWIVDDPHGVVRVEARFGPAQLFRIGLVVSMLGSLVCVAVVAGSLVRARRP